MPSIVEPSALTIRAPTLCSARSAISVADPGIGSDGDDVLAGLVPEYVADPHRCTSSIRCWFDATRVRQSPSSGPAVLRQCPDGLRTVGVSDPSGRLAGPARAQLVHRAGPAGRESGSSCAVGQRAEERQRGLVEVPVGGERVAAERAVGAVEGGEPAAGLGDDHVERRHVVELQLRLGRDVDRALGDEHVRPEVAVGPGAPAASRRREEVVAAGRAPPSRAREE